MAAPGSPKARATPSRLRISTAARAAVIRGMGYSSSVSAGGTAGQLFGQLEQSGVVKGAVTAGDKRGDELGDNRSERDHDPAFTGRGLHDAQVLVVQVKPEARLEVAL